MPKKLIRTYQFIRFMQIVLISGLILSGGLFLIEKFKFHSLNYSALIVLASFILVLILLRWLSPKMIQRQVYVLNSDFSEKYLSVLLASLAYRSVRPDIFNHLAVHLPELRRLDLSRIKWKRWKIFFRTIKSGPSEYIYLAPEIALILGDKRSLPYLKQILESQNITRDTYFQIQDAMSEIQENTQDAK